MVSAQPGAVDLQAAAAEKQNGVIREHHQAGDDQRRQQLPANSTILNGGARRPSPRLPGFGSLHSLSVKQKHPRDVQANIDDNGDVESVRERRGGGVHPVERAPVRSRDNTVRFAGGKHASLWGNNCVKS